jgi:hypothetical protein
MAINLSLFQIIIEKAPTSVPLGGAHFNMKAGVWDVKRLLEVRHQLPRPPSNQLID